ncbi:MAG: DUF3500 domain-containing protein [Chloroflexi bacterium]|nr:DUF3500 domain-containing protein [Chloroflexota bacterium]
MTRRLTRREALKLMALGGLGGLVAACAPSTVTPAPIQVATRVPFTPTSAAGLINGNATVAATPASTVASASASPAAVATPGVSTSALTGEMALAAAQFLETLDGGQDTRAAYSFADSERTRWHWTTPSNFPRNGLPLRDMATDQRDRALALLQASVSAGGLQKSLDIISLQNDLGNDPALYFVSVFGAPDGTEPWGWRFEGHHLSLHFTVAGEQVALMPFFLGAWPTVNDAGLKAMEREEWAARELITSLQGTQQATAIFQANSLTRHVTQNQPYVSPLDPVGVLVGDLSPDGQALVLEIMQNYLNTLPEPLATAQWEKINSAGFESIQFGWAGSLEPRRPYYYRLQGPTFLLEHDNSRSGGTHIHSVWRDFTEDFGQHLLG